MLDSTFSSHAVVFFLPYAFGINVVTDEEAGDIYPAFTAIKLEEIILENARNIPMVKSWEVSTQIV